MSRGQNQQSFIVRFLAIVLILALIPTALNTAFAAPPAGSTWTLVWSDEFNDTSIDSDKWAWGQLPWGGYYQGGAYASYTTAEDSYLSNGSLILRSRKGDFGGQPWSQGFMFGHEWSLYGYGEIRAKHTRANGIWVGWWSLHYGWPPEFDPAEYYGTDDLMRMGLCYEFGGATPWDRVFVGPEDWENWHTYGIEWGPGYAYFYMDDVLKHSIEASYVPDVPMYLILQSGMDATYDSNTPNPNYYEVDYIRWYKDDNLPRYQSEDYLPLIKDCTHEDVTYTGTWYPWTGNPVWMGNEYYSIETGALAEFSFTGTKVAYFSSKRNDLGHAEILLDDELVATVDCYNRTTLTHQKLYESPDLTYGNHTLGVRVKGTKNVRSRGVEIIIDAFRYSTYSGPYCGDGSCDPNSNNETQCNCPGDCGTPPSTETSCTDDIDNDCDGYTDCNDTDCDADPACSGSCGDDTCDEGEDQCNCPDDCGTPPSTETNCDDGIDNDCDTYTDCDDSDCESDPICDCLEKGQACTEDAECCSGDCLPSGKCK